MEAEPVYSLYVLGETNIIWMGNISGGTITNNYSGTGENEEENAIVLMGWDPNLTEDTGFADLHLSDSPVITGSNTFR